MTLKNELLPSCNVLAKNIRTGTPEGLKLDGTKPKITEDFLVQPKISKNTMAKLLYPKNG